MTVRTPTWEGTGRAPTTIQLGHRAAGMGSLEFGKVISPRAIEAAEDAASMGD